MTAQTRANLKLEFETGDTPDGDNYADLIDSFISISDTSAQTINSDLTVAGLTATTVSAQTVNTSAMSATILNISEASAAVLSWGSATGTNLTLTGTVSASAGNFEVLRVGGQPVTTGVSAAVVEVYITATASTAIGSQGVFVTANGVTSAAATALVDFTHSSPFELTYIGTDTKNFHIVANMSVISAGSNENMSGAVMKNGAVVARSRIERRIGTGSDRGAFGVGTIIQLTSGETVSLALANDSATSNLTLKAANMQITEV